LTKGRCNGVSPVTDHQKRQPPLRLLALIESEDIAEEILTAIHLPA
jgi:hypothetical protein